MDTWKSKIEPLQELNMLPFYRGEAFRIIDEDAAKICLMNGKVAPNSHQRLIVVPTEYQRNHNQNDLRTLK